MRYKRLFSWYLARLSLSDEVGAKSVFCNTTYFFRISLLMFLTSFVVGTVMSVSPVGFVTSTGFLLVLALSVHTGYCNVVIVSNGKVEIYNGLRLFMKRRRPSVIIELSSIESVLVSKYLFSGHRNLKRKRPMMVKWVRYFVYLRLKGGQTIAIRSLENEMAGLINDLRTRGIEVRYGDLKRRRIPGRT